MLLDRIDVIIGNTTRRRLVHIALRLTSQSQGQSDYHQEYNPDDNRKQKAVYLFHSRLLCGSIRFLSIIPRYAMV